MSEKITRNYTMKKAWELGWFPHHNLYPQHVAGAWAVTKLILLFFSLEGIVVVTAHTPVVTASYGRVKEGLNQ